MTDDLEIRNEQAEWSAIRCCMITGKVPAGLSALVADDFRSDPTRKAWSAIQTIYGSGRRITYQELEKSLGSSAALDVDRKGRESAADPKASDNYATDIMDASTRRAVVARCRVAAGVAIDPSKPVQMALEAMSMRGDRLRQVRQLSTAADLIDQSIAFLEAPMEQMSQISIPTGIRRIDDATGGVPRGLVTILAGRPGTGKSTLAMNIATNAAGARLRVLYVSLEDVAHYLGLRIVSYLTGVDYGDLTHHRTTPQQIETVKTITTDYRDMTMKADFLPRQTAASIRMTAISQQQSDGLDLLIVDHLTEMANDHNAYASTSEQVKGIRDIAKELDCAVLLLCQLNRKGADRQDATPKVTDLRDSGKIEEVARNIWLLYRESTEPGIVGRMQLDVAKATHGQTGVIDLRCDMAHMRID